jgi:type IV secretory pathway VirJ component
VAREAIGSFVGASAKADKTKVKTLDVLQAEGFVSTDFVAPDKGKDRALYDSLKAAVVLGFEVRFQTLLAKDTKTLDDDAKALKKTGNSRSVRMTDLKNGLAKRENPEGEKATASFEARLKRDLTKYIAQIEKGEAFSFTVIDMLKYLKSASVLIK